MSGLETSRLRNLNPSTNPNNDPHYQSTTSVPGTAETPTGTGWALFISYLLRLASLSTIF